jgi:hypothetical protein
MGWAARIRLIFRPVTTFSVDNGHVGSVVLEWQLEYGDR